MHIGLSSSLLCLWSRLSYSSSPDSQSTVLSEVNEELVKSDSTNNTELQHESHHLFIIRTDYTLHSYSSYSKLLWNMTVSEID